MTIDEKTHAMHRYRSHTCGALSPAEIAALRPSALAALSRGAFQALSAAEAASLPGVQGPDNSRPSGGGAGDGVLSPSQPGLLGPV